MKKILAFCLVLCVFASMAASFAVSASADDIQVSIGQKFEYNSQAATNEAQLAWRKQAGSSDGLWQYEMYSLEQGIAMAVDPNRKGRLMIKYAIGIKNSFDFCWPLTQYYCGTTYYSQVCEKRDWTTEELAHAAREKVEHLLQSAFGLFTDDEVAAEMHYALCNFRTVATKFPDTEMGELVRGKCDCLYDHDPLSHRYSSCGGYDSYF
jgi:hypothetical protein